MARTLLARAAPHNASGVELARLARFLPSPAASDATAVAVGQAVDGSTLGGQVVLDPKTGLPIAGSFGTPTPFYAKPLLVVGGNKFPAAVAASTLLGGVAGYLFGGPLWALGALVAGNLAGRAGASYVCAQAASTGENNQNCDQATAWGTAPLAF